MYPLLRTLALAAMLARPALGQSHVLPRSVDSAAVPLTIGLELSQPMGIALTSGGFFLADMHNPSVSKHAADGRLLWQLKAKGRGPGDILQPYRIAATSDGGVLVFDQMVRDFSKFSSSGAFVKRFRMNITLQTVDNIAVLPNGQIAIAGYTRDPRAAAGAVHLFSEAGAWERSVGPLPETKDVSKLQYLGAGLLDMRPDGRLLFTRKGPYEILEFGLRGGIRRLKVPRVIGPIADSAIDISTDAKGTERISSRSALMTVPLRTISVGDSSYLSMYSQRRQIVIALHSASGVMLGPEIQVKAIPAVFDAARCRFLGFQTRDDEPTLVEIALLPRADRAAPRRATDRAAPCRP